MSTDLALHTGPSTGLSIDPDQSAFTDQQVAVLRHIGVENASEGDLAVFFHVVKRTGLDPFARQIHMVGRNTKNQRTQQWETKYTIQTGIDGYRLIGRRAADAARVRVSVSAPQWADRQGQWHDIWLGGTPAAAKVTITRDGEPFTAVAIFDEYAQTTKDGSLNSMWRQRPAGQIAKCAEALAWRMAFPQDLAGVYVEDELHQAENERPAPAAPRPAADRVAAVLRPPTENVHDAEVLHDSPVQGGAKLANNSEPLTDHTRRQMFAELTKHGITDPDKQRAGMSRILGRPIASRSELSEDDARAVVLNLQARALPDADPTQPGASR